MTVVAESTSLLAEILKALRISTIVCVDDAYLTMDTVSREDLLSIATVAVTTPAALQRLEQLLPNTGFSGDDTIWRTDLQNWWEATSESEQKELVRELGALIGSVPTQDVKAASQLRALIDSIPDVQLLELTPEQWVNDGADIVAGCEADARLLCLFDQDLSAAGLTETGGIMLIDRLLAQIPDPPEPLVICALLTHTLKKEDEEPRWRELAAQYEMKLSRVLPVSKERLEDSDEFARGVRLAVLNLAQERMKETIEKVVTASVSTATDEVKALSVWDFDQIVMRSSNREGVWEADTLLRIYALLEKRARRTRALVGDARAILDGSVRITRSMQQSGTAVLGQPGESRQWILRHAELFMDEEVNSLALPTELGDIYSMGEKKYLFLAQPCDLMPRVADGQRKATSGVVVAILNKERSKKSSSPLSRNEQSMIVECPYLNAEDDGKYWYVDLRDAFEVSLDMIDLACLRVDGACRFDPNEEFSVLLFESWYPRAKAVKQRFLSLVSQMNEVVTALEKGGMATDEIESATARMLSGFSLDPEVLQPSYKEGVIEFGLKRVGRMLPPISNDVLSRYEAFRARPAFEHDFGVA